MQYSTETFLQRLGLSQNEAKVYLAALQLGESSISKVADFAHVHRVAVYGVVEALCKKGLLTAIDHPNGKKVSANSPKAIEKIIADDRRAIRKMELQYENVFPVLQSLFTKATIQPKVRFFEGKEAVEQMSHDIIDTLSPYPESERVAFSYTNPKRLYEKFDEEIFGDGGYIDRRIEYGIRVHVIVPESTVTNEYLSHSEEQLREMLILPPEIFPVQNDLTIYGNKIAFQSIGEELIGVVIESQELADDQRTYFKLAWEGAKAIQNGQKMSL